MNVVKAMCVLACCAGVTLMAAGCNSNSSKKTGSAGAVSDKACCTDKSGCTDKAAATTTTKGSMGAVGAKSSCCSGDAAKKTN
jgi:hypothetical protein